MKPIRIFSQAEVIQCLNNRKMYIAGDSYSLNLAIGLTDLLVGNVSNANVTTHAERLSYMRMTVAMMKQTPYLEKIDVNFVCNERPQCVGDAPNLKTCRNCLESLGPADVTVVGAAVHLLNYPESSVHSVMNSIKWFLETTPNIIWTSVPSYNGKVVPSQLTKRIFGTTATYVLSRGPTGLMRKITNFSPNGVPFLDFYELSRVCLSKWSNCTTDGGHRSRFMNRMKAQMLVNMLCEPKPLV